MDFMKYMLFILFVCGLIGCNDGSGKLFGNDVTIVEVDSCQYVIYKGYRQGGVVHHNNCKYCKQRNNSQLRVDSSGYILLPSRGSF